jgi:1,4-dihydroxy-2-naphthoyl-CoA hydrolase
MSIWKTTPDLDRLNHPTREHLGTNLGIEFTRVTEESLEARLPVDERTRQPYGILHGGASVVLAETVGSVASHHVVGQGEYIPVGLEVNANHLKSVSEGFVTAVCRPVHLGRTTHVWDIRLHDDKGRATCISRLTVAIVPKPKLS